MMKANRKNHPMQRNDEHDRPGDKGRAAAFAMLFASVFIGLAIFVIHAGLGYFGFSEKTINGVIIAILLLVFGGIIYSTLRANNVTSSKRKNWPWD